MRWLTVLASLLLAGAIAGSVGAASPNAGELSVEGGKGVVVLEIRGAVLGRLASGTLRVADLSPRDPYAPLVTGRRVSSERIGPRTVVYRGVGLRFRMVGGGYRIVARGRGLSLSAVGVGFVTLAAEPKLLDDDVGVYSLDGVDCGFEPELCTPLPAEPERYALAPTPDSNVQRR